MCVMRVCVPNALGCADNTTAFACNEDGSQQELSPCGDAQYCQDGECVRQVCEPEEVVCDGNLLRTCDAIGAAFSEEDCLADEACEQGEWGCTCQEGACVARRCAPETSECVGNATRRCTADGLGFEDIVPCEGEQVCQAGGCIDPGCEASETECAGDILLTCAEDGETREEEDCQSQGQFCQTEDSAQCTDHICEPESRFCQGSLAVQCNAR